MQRFLNFMKTYKVIVAAVLAFAGGILGTNIVLQTGPVEKPEVIIIIPEYSPEPLVAEAGPDIRVIGERRGLLLDIASTVAGRRYAHEIGLTPHEGVLLAKSIPQEEVSKACLEKFGTDPTKLSYETNSRGQPVRGPLIDWLKTPGNLEKLIQILMVLLPLFA